MLTAIIPEVEISNKLKVYLKDGERTTVYIVRYRRQTVRPRLAILDYPMRLADWCRKESVGFAIGGGFTFLYMNHLLGEYWKDGRQMPSFPFPAPWNRLRGSALITSDGDIEIEQRHQLPKQPKGDLLQAGPLLVRNGKSLIGPGEDPEDFTCMADLFEPNPAVGRHPRSAIGINEDYIWTIACDGRSEHDAGMTWHELADFMVKLGATEALNLDGGGGTSLVAHGQLLNIPRGEERDWPGGRLLKTAIAFEPV